MGSSPNPCLRPVRTFLQKILDPIYPSPIPGSGPVQCEYTIIAIWDACYFFHMLLLFSNGQKLHLNTTSGSGAGCRRPGTSFSQTIYQMNVWMS